MMLHEVCGRLLPPQAALHLDTIAMEDHGLTLDVAVTTPQATCPDCTQPSTHIHSDYRRTLTDLPWATTPVTLHLRVRRFWCATPSCGRQTFAERVPQIAPHYAQPVVLRSLAGMTQETLAHILEGRQRSMFTSLQDFRSRVGIAEDSTLLSHLTFSRGPAPAVFVVARPNSSTMTRTDRRTRAQLSDRRQNAIPITFIALIERSASSQ